VWQTLLCILLPCTSQPATIAQPSPCCNKYVHCNCNRVSVSVGHGRPLTNWRLQALLIQEELYEPDSLRIGSTLNSMGVLYNMRMLTNKKRSPRVLHDFTIDDDFGDDGESRIALGDDHRFPRTPVALNNLLEEEDGSDPEEQDCERAESSFNQAVAIYSHRTTQSHSAADLASLVIALRNLSSFLLARRRGAEAREFFEHLLALQEQEFPDTPELLQTLLPLAKVCRTTIPLSRCVSSKHYRCRRCHCLTWHWMHDRLAALLTIVKEPKAICSAHYNWHRQSMVKIRSSCAISRSV
jgi:hypothetical protein